MSGKKLTGPVPLGMHIGGARVRPTSRCFVVPATPTEDHWLPLSNLDRAVNPTFSSVILFYKCVVNTPGDIDVTKSLKQSLSKALVHFYPLAGRLALREDGLVDLHCNDEGAVFLEATAEADLSSIGGAKPMPALSGLEVARLDPGPNNTYVPDQLQSMPVLVIMLTKFKCGSIAIAANWHHTVADGSSGCHFMKSWAEVASGKSISLVPIHDRLLLRAREPPNFSFISGYNTRSVQVEAGVVDGEVDTGGCREFQKYEQLPKDTTMLASFHITKDSIQKLKENLSLGCDDPHGIHFSSAECIAAQLWWQMTKARKNENSTESVNLRRNPTTRFFMFVDGRKRMNLPVGYFGNVVCSTCATAGEDEILSRPLSYAANLIRNATTKISGDYFRDLIDWIEIQGRATPSSEHMNSRGHDVAATFWTFFPLYEIDFGWGKPELAARNSPPRPLIDGIAMMPSSEGHGAMVALLNLHADRMERMKKQDSFKAHFAL